MSYARALVRLTTAAAVAFGVALPLQAAVRLAYEGNVGLRNPYSPPGDIYFGRTVTAGDFNGDGIDDLVVTEGSGTRMRVLLGVAWTVGSSGIVIKFLPTTVTTPSFNGGVTTGDFDADGRDEIALGNPSYSQGGLPSQGSVAIMDRAANGTWSVQETIRMGLSGYAGTPGQGDRLGAVMASGDFDEDGFDDLAIAAPNKTVAAAEDAGAVLIAYGSASGLTASGSEVFTRQNDGQGLAPAADDRFGTALAVADFSGDGPQDLAVGIRAATCPNDARGGAVVVLRGSGGGLTSVQSRVYFAGVNGVPGACVNSRAFGSGLTTGYFNLDARPDLAIGADGQASERGSVTVLPSGGTGPNGGQGSQLIRGIDLPVPIAAGADIGRVLDAGPLRGSANLLDSLVLGAAFDDAEGMDQAGSVWVLHPAADGSGLSLAGAERWTLRAPLTIAPAGTNDQFGSALAIGDFNDDNARDLAIGTYLNDNQDVDAGAVQVIYQSEFLFRDGFED